MQSTYRKSKLALIGSGTGTNIASIILACSQLDFPAEVVLLVSNKKDAGIYTQAKTLHVPFYFIDLKMNSPVIADELVVAQLEQAEVEYVILAGALWKIGKQTIAAFPKKILNIHPADPKRFGGKGMFGRHVHEAVLKSGEKYTYPTVHYVDEVFDHGDIILQMKVPIFSSDTPDSLASRVLQVEHVLYPNAIKKIMNEKSL